MTIPWNSRSVALILWATIAVGCASPPMMKFEGKTHTNFEEPASNWPLHPLRSESLMRDAPMKVISERYAGAGISGASRVEVRYPGEDQSLTLKWKTMPGDLDGINNSPRREIASYRAQFLFLEPEDFVVPPSVARCLVPGYFAEPERHRDRIRSDSTCELGVLSLWLRDVTIPDPLYDEARFVRDPTYARYLANFNLLTYLIRHRDGRNGNFLIATDEARPITFAIDNGISFGGFFYNWFVDNWDDIEVAALPRESIERLRKITHHDLRKLGVVAELRLDADGVYRSAEHSENLDPEDGVRTRPGVIQLGLTEHEIEDMSKRIDDLLEKVDRGEIQLF